MKEYPILRSGFITHALKGFTQPGPDRDAPVLAILGKSRFVLNNDNFYHEGIQQLFEQNVREAMGGGVKDIIFLENLIKCAREAFGTSSFWEWIDLQSQNPGFTSTHQSFIIQTLEYLTGKPRGLYIMNWIKILEAGHIGDFGTIRIDHYAKQLKEIRDSKKVPGLLRDTIVQWLRQPGGVGDFVMSLEIIFGNRRAYLS